MDERLREIGARLKDEEAKFLDYRAIEEKSRELGFATSERTLRFYVTEGILPPPARRGGKTPVYEEDWILNVLLAIHVMKTRLGRSLAEIRDVLRNLTEDPAGLADKTSALYEDYVKGDAIPPAAAARLVDAFFARLQGRDGKPPEQPSEISILDLAQAIGRSWGEGAAAAASAPPPRAGPEAAPAGAPAFAGFAGPAGPRAPAGSAESTPADPPAPAGPPAPAWLASPAASAAAAAAPPPPPADLERAKRLEEGERIELEDEPPAAEVAAREPAGAPPAPAPASAVKVTPLSLPEGAVLVEKAKALEELFISRFDEAFAAIRRVPHPAEQQLYPAGLRDRIHLKRTRSDEVIDLMKRHRVYERELLEALPLDEISEYRIFTRSIFGKKDVRVVAAACSVSPIEDFITKKCSLAKAGPRDLERALEAVGPREGAFYYVGVLATTGWEPGAERHIPSAPNVLVALVENKGGTEWTLWRHDDERWGGLLRLFDPESEREKIERVRRRIETHPELALRGGHVIVKNLGEDLGVSDAVLAAAIREALARDEELSVLEVGGKEIIKRRRI